MATKGLPLGNSPWVQQTRAPTQEFLQFMQNVAQLFGTLKNAANDTAAANAGVGVGQFYRNGSAIQVRVS
jgi:hypothetical protein